MEKTAWRCAMSAWNSTLAVLLLMATTMTNTAAADNPYYDPANKEAANSAITLASFDWTGAGRFMTTSL